VRDKEGKPYTVRYDAVNSMLLNEFLKEHRKVQELEKQVEKLTAGLQKVSDRLKASEAAPQMVANKQYSESLLCTSEPSICFVKRNRAFQVAARIQNTNLAGAEARAGFGIIDSVLLLRGHRLDAWRFKDFPVPAMRSDLSHCHCNGPAVG
jgi:hypothetical protein